MQVPDRRFHFQGIYGKVEPTKLGTSKIRGGSAKNRIEFSFSSKQDNQLTLTNEAFNISGKIYTRGEEFPKRYVKAKFNPTDNTEVLLSINSLSKRLKISKKEILKVSSGDDGPDKLGRLIKEKLEAQLKEPPIKESELPGEEKKMIKNNINILLSPKKSPTDYRQLKPIFDKYKNDKEFIFELAEREVNALFLAGDKLKNDPDFLVVALKKLPGYEVPKRLRTDPNIMDQQNENFKKFGSQ